MEAARSGTPREPATSASRACAAQERKNGRSASRHDTCSTPPGMLRRSPSGARIRASRVLACVPIFLALARCGAADPLGTVSTQSTLGDAAPSPDAGDERPGEAAAPPDVADEPSGDEASSPDAHCAAHGPPVHRPTPVACSRTAFGPWPPGADAAVLAPCKTDADCPAPKPGGWTYYCRQGLCGIDQCLSDADCAQGESCACANEYYGGNGIHPDLCMPAKCRVDADCGAGGLCGPAITGYCGGLSGYFCHSAADECTADADCCSDRSRPSCGYSPPLGHWACQAFPVCNG
jgi:hypothetical protein